MFSLLDKRIRKLSELTGSPNKKNHIFSKIRAVPCQAQPFPKFVPCRAGGTQFEVCRAVPVPVDFSESFASLS